MPDSFEFVYEGISLRLTNTGSAWRLQSRTGNGFDDNGAAQTISADLKEDRDFSAEPLEIDKTDIVTVTAPDNSSVTVTGKKISFYDATGKCRRVIRHIKAVKDGIKVSLVLSSDEQLYGTGERFDSVSRRGRKVHIYAIDKWCRIHGNSYVPIPLLISSQSTGIFMNRYEHSVIDAGSYGKKYIIFTQKYAPVDLYIFMCSSVSAVINEYSALTGFAPMPEEWCFGTLVCRYHPEFQTPEGVFNMIDAMRNNDFPWNAVILEGFRPYDKANWPSLITISERVHSEGKKMMLYEQCGRFTSDCDIHFGMTDDMAVNSDNGIYLKETRSMNLLDNFSKKAMRCIDLTNENAVRKWSESRQEMLDLGVDGAKIDFCEQFPDKPGIRFADGRNPMAAHHWYPTLYSSIRYRQFATRPDGGLCFARGGGIGAQRFPFIWAGDQLREFRFLKAVIKAALSCGLSGIPFVSWDMAGYQPAFNPYDKRHEDKVFLRGIEFTAFSPCIQTHGRVKRPYDFDEHTKDVYRAYANLHRCLIPYISETARTASETGMPVMRHLCLYDSSDKKCLETEDEYMLGGSLLVAPVLSSGRHRNIYLPRGEWTEIFTGMEYNGGSVIKNYSVPPESVPVFRLKSSPSETIDKAIDAAQVYIDEINSLSNRC